MAVSLILSDSAIAQSVLNFARTPLSERVNARIAVTNPSTNFADVQFTLYGNDGNPVSAGLVNPVRYRVAPKGQVSMMASDLFAGSRADGWIQATSPAPGLLGYYVSGDFTSTLEGSEALPAFLAQIIPVVRQDQSNKTELVVLNPGSVNGTVTITLFNSPGQELGASVIRSIGAHAALRLPVPALIANVPGGNLSVRITSSVPVSAVAAIERGDSVLFAGGQAADQPATVRIAPHFVTGDGFDSVLILANPAPSPTAVTVTLFNETDGSTSPALTTPSQRAFNIPANGSIAVEAASITGVPFSPTVKNGWLRIDSANITLGGLLILDRGQSLTAVPLQSAPLDRFLYSQISETQKLFTGLVWINSSSGPAVLSVSLIHPDGATFGQGTFEVPANSKFSALLGEIIPRAVDSAGGYVFVRSSIPVWSTAIIGGWNYDFLATMPASRMTDSFAPNPFLSSPAITTMDPSDGVRPGATLRVSVADLAGDAVFSIAGQVIPARPLAPGFPVFTMTIPNVEPGFVKLRVRSNGLESAPVPLRILPNDNLPAQIISGRAFYQKIDVTNDGLDLSHPAMVPIRNGRVEVFDRASQSLVAVSDTDLNGKFEVPVPMSPNLTVRVLSRLRSGELRVSDNTNLNAAYMVTEDIDARETVGRVVLSENSRLSGAFNILEMIQRGNEAVRTADPNIVLAPQVTIFWSTGNTRRLIGTTYFNAVNNTAFVMGDRNDDSDEFDDSVILHEYAHMLAARFSRDDSPGGFHALGDILDPRLAWSEGWANFFSCAVRNDPIYRDSRGPNGATVLRQDLENIPSEDRPGYWSETSVGTLLWDLVDDRVDAPDNVQYPFSLIWGAFTDLQRDRFVYLPYYLERFLARNPAAVEPLRIMVQSRAINFQPNVRPSVTNPFPRIIDIGESVTGTVDSLTPKRNNLMQSSHFLTFTTGGGNASVRLDIIGPGPAESSGANDLDLFLLDANGRMLDRSDRGLNGQSELISYRLPAGTYVVEVRSFYTKAETGELAFNSGQYRLSVLVQ